MGRLRMQVLIGLGLVMFLGMAAYIKLWTLDYRISAQEARLLRQQFDLANREAMDESAEWRHRYDDEAKKLGKCLMKLDEARASLKAVDASESNKKLVMLQKENVDLLERIETLEKSLKKRS